MWCLRLSDSQRDALRDLIKEQEELGSALSAALEAIDYARWDDLPDATLPWDRVAELAATATPRPRTRPAKKAARRVSG